MKHLPAILSLLVASPLLAQCPLPAAGASQNQNGVIFDGWTAAIPIGFAFPFKGATYDAVFVSDHGLVALTTVAGGPAAPPAGAWTYSPDPASLSGTPGPVLAGYWSDHSISYGTNAGEIYVDIGGSGTQCTVSWIDAETYIDGGVFSNSITLYSDGRIVFTLDNRVNNEGSTFDPRAVVGIGVPGVANTAVNMGTDTTVASDTFSELFTTPTLGTPNPNFDLANMTLTFIDVGVGAGWAIVQGALPCAGATSVGTGCDGLALVTTAAPVIGGTWDLTLSGVNAASIGFGLPNFLAFGGSIAPAPIGVLVPDLFGATCFLYQDASLGLLDGGPASPTGDVLFSIAVPNTVFLANAPLAVQGVSFRDLFTAPTFSLSNGENGTIGY